MNIFNNATSAKILLIDNTESEPKSLSVVLEQGSFNFTKVSSLEKAITALEQSEIHVAVVMMRHEQFDSSEIVRNIKHISPFTEVIVVTSPESQDEIGKVDEAGAFDSILEPVSTDRMLLRIRKAVQYRNIKLDRSFLKEQTAMRYGFDNIVGISESISELKNTIGRIAPTDIPVMITGASGTGKELVARIIHHHSNRREHEFVMVDCSALPEDMLAVQLFESDSGRSESDRSAGLSLLERADGGTLVLDSAECLDKDIQNRLESFLKNFTIYRPDGQSRRLDIRFVTIAREDLSAKVAEGEFSQYLFDKLSTIVIKLPGLAEREEDIEILTEYFLRTIASESNSLSKTITRTAIDRLHHYTWPGNVRELENTLRRAVALCGKSQLDVDDISFINSGSVEQTFPGQGINSKRTATRLDENQRSLIKRVLGENEWNYTQTAQELGIGRTTLWRKVKKYNLKKETNHS